MSVDKAILQEEHQRKKNLETVWIDYRKAYDSVPHTWIQYYLQLFQVENICGFTSQVMVQWPTQLFCNNHLLGTACSNTMWYFPRKKQFFTPSIRLISYAFDIDFTEMC